MLNERYGAILLIFKTLCDFRYKYVSVINFFRLESRRDHGATGPKYRQQSSKSTSWYVLVIS